MTHLTFRANGRFLLACVVLTTLTVPANAGIVNPPDPLLPANAAADADLALVTQPAGEWAPVGALPTPALASSAEGVLLASKTPTGTNADRAIENARIGTRYQAALLGVEIATATVASHHKASEALAAWVSASGGESIGARDLAWLDASPDAAGIARVIDAFALAQVASGASTAARFSARLALLDATQALVDAHAPTSAQLAGNCLYLDHPATPSYFLDLSGCDTGAPSDSHFGGQCVAQDYSLVLDLGGNDVYCDNAGGTAWDRASSSYSAAYMANLGGNDQYVGGDFGRTSGVNGGAMSNSAGFLFDSAGNDVFRGGVLGGGQTSAANGGGNSGGSGLLVDASGDDSYFSGWGGGNGGGALAGYGMLIDQSGNDKYAGLSGQDAYGGINGGAYYLGSGYLFDVAGNDVYAGGSAGVNGGGWCGLGYLHDGAGDDSYAGRYAGVNGGAEAGYGHLVDDAGNDRFVALGDGSNGAGEVSVRCNYNPGLPQVGHGLLTDASGCDYYSDGYAPAGYDKTVLAKGGSFGAQIDSPALNCLTFKTCTGPQGAPTCTQGSGLPRLQVADDTDHTCVLLSLGIVDCYGVNFWDGSQRSDYNTNLLSAPAVQIASSEYATCALLGGASAGNVHCWGYNGGWGDYTGGDATQASTGNQHNCVLRTGGNVYCWGRNSEQQSKPYNGQFGPATQVSAGTFNTCALLANASVYCWGIWPYQSHLWPSYWGQDATSVSAGSDDVCATLTSGNVRCWAYNFVVNVLYQPATTNPQNKATQVVATNHFYHTGEHICWLRADGFVPKCWGDNTFGQSVGWPNQGVATQLAAGGDHTCVLTTSNKVECHGLNDFGQSMSYP